MRNLKEIYLLDENNIYDVCTYFLSYRKTNKKIITKTDLIITLL